MVKLEELQIEYLKTKEIVLSRISSAPWSSAENKLLLSIYQYLWK